MKTYIFSLLLLISFLLSACSEDNNQDKKTTSGDHVWKEQTKTMEKAKAVEGILEDAAQEQRKMIEENIQ